MSLLSIRYTLLVLLVTNNSFSKNLRGGKWDKNNAEGGGAAVLLTPPLVASLPKTTLPRLPKAGSQAEIDQRRNKKGGPCLPLRRTHLVQRQHKRVRVPGPADQLPVPTCILVYANKKNSLSNIYVLKEKIEKIVHAYK